MNPIGALSNDVWTFSVVVPDSTSDADASQSEIGSSKKFRVMKLQRTLEDESSFRSKVVPAKTQTMPTSNATATTADTSTSDNDERASLLTTSTETKPQVSPLKSTGWTFSSPFWTLQSSILLRMVYKSAWQRLPSYTTTRCCQSQTRMLGTVGSFAKASFLKCCCSCCAIEDPFHSICLTTDDIDSVESLASLEIRGVGECSAIRLYLAWPEEAFQQAVPSNIPSEYRENLDEHMEHARSNRQGDDNFLRSMKQEVDVDLASADSLEPTGHTRGPTITFAMPKDTTHDDDEPPLLWKVEIPPAPKDLSIALETLTVLDGPLLPQSQQHNPTHMFINGFQSWSFAGSVPLGQPQPQSAMPDVYSRAFNHGASVPPNSLEYVPSHRAPLWRSTSKSRNTKPYLSDFFTCITSHEEEEEDDEVATDTVNADGSPDNRRQGNLRRGPFRRAVVHTPLDERGGPALILGWLSQRHQFGIISVDPDLQRLQMHASHQGQLLLPSKASYSGRVLQTDWAFAQLEAPHTYDEEPLVHYLRAVAGYNGAKPLQNGPLLTGWCSWYHYYTNIDEESLRANFATLSKLRKTCPTNVSVVDDGYMTAWGDWNSLKPGKFSSRDSMKSVADNIRDERMRPGIWLAPFAADKNSVIVQEHPDWIIRNEQGIPANSAHCGKYFYGLDATNPEVLQYVFTCIRRAVQEWGYTVLKIDFLYAACLEGNGKHDPSLSRAQAMHLAMHTIRSAAGPNTFLIGCGCPLGSGVGYVDGMRVSADTGPSWYPSFPLPSWDQGTLPSLRGMIRNSITRAPLGHRWWHNDPDCLMLGSTTRLTLEEVASSASIVALTCGMLLLSDDLTKVSPARMHILTKIFPMTGVTAVVLDLHSLQDGHSLPTMLRLWCTDAFEKRDDFRKNTREKVPLDYSDRDHNEEAGFFSTFAAFRPGSAPAHPNERQRSCIHMVRGLGTWTVLSLSNWLDRAAVVHIPPLALAPPPEASSSTSYRKAINPKHGYHVFSFWSSKYNWISGTPEYPDTNDHIASNHNSSASNQPLLSKLLGPHETEIFHVKPVTPQKPQYLGSDIHFSCGQEVDLFQAEKNRLTIQLRTEYYRAGHIFVFVPVTNTSHVKATCADQPCRSSVVGNTPQYSDGRGPSPMLGRVIQVAIIVHGDRREMDGKIIIDF